MKRNRFFSLPVPPPLEPEERFDAVRRRAGRGGCLGGEGVLERRRERALSLDVSSGATLGAGEVLEGVVTTGPSAKLWAGCAVDEVPSCSGSDPGSSNLWGSGAVLDLCGVSTGTLGPSSDSGELGSGVLIFAIAIDTYS